MTQSKDLKDSKIAIFLMVCNLSPTFVLFVIPDSLHVIPGLPWNLMT